MTSLLIPDKVLLMTKRRNMTLFIDSPGAGNQTPFRLLDNEFDPRSPEHRERFSLESKIRKSLIRGECLFHCISHDARFQMMSNSRVMNGVLFSADLDRVHFAKEFDVGCMVSSEHVEAQLLQSAKRTMAEALTHNNRIIKDRKILDQMDAAGKENAKGGEPDRR